MRHAVCMIAYNNLELTKRAVESVLNQDIPVDLKVFDNGSTDGTWDWLCAQGKALRRVRFSENTSPLEIGNIYMRNMFGIDNGGPEEDHIFGVPNDVILPPNLFRLMLDFPRAIVTASMTSDPNFQTFEKATAVSECTPLCVSLIRKWAYDAIVDHSGYFWDEGFWHYASDCDLAIRMGACGIRGVQLDVQYYHETSATLKRSDPEKKRAMELQADADRAYFVRKWGFGVQDPYYGQCCGDINHKGCP